MENQHRKIKGYRELTQEEIDLMNEIKERGRELGELVDRLHQSAQDGMNATVGTPGCAMHGESMRWASIGKTHLQQGLMALTRAVAKPDFF